MSLVGSEPCREVTARTGSTCIHISSALVVTVIFASSIKHDVQKIAKKSPCCPIFIAF